MFRCCRGRGCGRSERCSRCGIWGWVGPRVSRLRGICGWSVWGTRWVGCCTLRVSIGGGYGFFARCRGLRIRPTYQFGPALDKTDSSFWFHSLLRLYNPSSTSPAALISPLPLLSSSPSPYTLPLTSACIVSDLPPAWRHYLSSQTDSQTKIPWWSQTHCLVPPLNA